MPDKTQTQTKAKANATTKAAQASAPIYQLRVDLLDTKPPIWRRLEMPGDATLGWLHAALQLAMGWTNSHLHQFMTADGRYSDPRASDGFDSDEEPDRDENKFTLMQVAPEVGAQFGYEYDFGDSWTHVLTVEAILPPDAKAAPVARCLDGERACPPEDCGGPGGFAELLKALKNPKHPEHEEMKAWLGGGFQAAAFDAAEVNRWLRQLKWPQVTEAQLRRVLMSRDGYGG